jgi:hypothetical protein
VIFSAGVGAGGGVERRENDAGGTAEHEDFGNARMLAPDLRNPTFLRA